MNRTVDVGAVGYTLKDGDEVQWNYSCDLGADLKGTDKEKAKEWKEKNE